MLIMPKNDVNDFSFCEMSMVGNKPWQLLIDISGHSFNVFLRGDRYIYDIALDIVGKWIFWSDSCILLHLSGMQPFYLSKHCCLSFWYSRENWAAALKLEGFDLMTDFMVKQDWLCFLDRINSEEEESPSNDKKRKLRKHEKGSNVAMNRPRNSWRLSLAPLGKIHAAFLDAMGMVLAEQHLVGRILVNVRRRQPGEVIVCCPIREIIVKDEDECHSLEKLILGSGRQSDTYLIQHRCRTLHGSKSSIFINPNFDVSDPIASGDLWYLLNHDSSNPSCHIFTDKDGITLKARRVISENEPLTWKYPAGFWKDEDQQVDIPKYVEVEGLQKKDDVFSELISSRRVQSLVEFSSKRSEMA